MTRSKQSKANRKARKQQGALGQAASSHTVPKPKAKKQKQQPTPPKRGADGLTKKERKQQRQFRGLKKLNASYQQPLPEAAVYEVSDTESVIAYDGPEVLVNLPNELLAAIMKQMDLQDLVALSQTCKKLRNLTGEEEDWHQRANTYGFTRSCDHAETSWRSLCAAICCHGQDCAACHKHFQHQLHIGRQVTAALPSHFKHQVYSLDHLPGKLEIMPKLRSSDQPRHNPPIAFNELVRCEEDDRPEVGRAEIDLIIRYKTTDTLARSVYLLRNHIVLSSLIPTSFLIEEISCAIDEPELNRYEMSAELREIRQEREEQIRAKKEEERKALREEKHAAKLELRRKESELRYELKRRDWEQRNADREWRRQDKADRSAERDAIREEEREARSVQGEDSPQEDYSSEETSDVSSDESSLLVTDSEDFSLSETEDDYPSDVDSQDREIISMEELRATRLGVYDGYEDSDTSDNSFEADHQANLVFWRETSLANGPPYVELGDTVARNKDGVSVLDLMKVCSTWSQKPGC